MPNSVMVAFLMESILVILTTVVLIQPKVLIQPDSKRLQAVMNWVGMFLLCLTFCWSIIFGIVLAMNDVVLQF